MMRVAKIFLIARFYTLRGKRCWSEDIGGTLDSWISASWADCRWSKIAKSFTIFFTGGEGLAGFAWTSLDSAGLSWTLIHQRRFEGRPACALTPGGRDGASAQQRPTRWSGRIGVMKHRVDNGFFVGLQFGHKKKVLESEIK